MPKAPGPCRFGQYAPYLRRLLDDSGYQDALVFSPNSGDNYGDLGDHASDLMRTAWMSMVTADIALRLLLKTRPYTTRAGDADEVFAQTVARFDQTLAQRDLTPKQRVAALVADVRAASDAFRALPAKYERGRPLIGLVGEIFCRLNTFSNEDTARQIERLGGECWLSDVAEWVWYTNWCREADTVRERGYFNFDYVKHKLKSHVQHGVEQALLAPLAEDYVGYEEPADIRELLDYSQPYLPATGAHGEMTLSVGKAIYLYRKGADGIIDISPFTCMNGICSEAVYPAVSADHDDIPIRSLYFDKTSANIERDLEIFLDLARGYQRRKRHPRRYPHLFENA
jgi:predicted nucleotide-binding protein (sugar kinase/HSP70/actin superfamily)